MSPRSLFLILIVLCLLVVVPVAADTAIIFANLDGRVSEEENQEWLPMRNSAGDTVDLTATSASSGQTLSTTTADPPTYSYHRRGFWSFGYNLSMPEGSTINSATVSVYGYIKTNGVGTVNFSIIDYTGANPPTAGDYDSTTFTRQATDVAYASFVTSGWNNIALTNLSQINTAGGNTTLMFTHSADVDASALVWASGVIYSGFSIRTMEQNSDYTGYITIDYTSGGGDPPVANFTSNETTVCAYDYVQFNDTSTNTPITWFWLFGDSQDSHIQDPVHYWDTPGSYTINLTAGNDYGENTTSKTDYITVNDCTPVANFTANVTEICAGDTVAFTDTSSNTPKTWDWDINGDWYDIPNPVYGFIVPGLYSINLTVSNDYGSDFEYKVDYINVTTCIVPTVDFTTNATCGVGNLSVMLTDVSTDAIEWYWDLGDGNVSLDRNISHLYETPGIYTVLHNATNAYGTVWENKTNLLTVAVSGTYCEYGGAYNTTGMTTGVPPRPIPLEPETLWIPFLIIPFAGLWYIFRGVEDHTNPVWADVLASGIAMVVSAFVAIWFFSGGITSVPITVENASYVIPSGVSLSDAQAIQESTSNDLSVLGYRGSGMFMRSAVSTAESASRAMTTVHTHDTIVIQYQDIGMTFLYAFLCLVSIALFVWTMKAAKNQLSEEKAEEDNPEQWRA